MQVRSLGGRLQDERGARRGNATAVVSRFQNPSICPQQGAGLCGHVAAPTHACNDLPEEGIVDKTAQHELEHVIGS
ncbi:hypothetical protein SAMN05444004_104156 [Jannaschia faecimaris]|uniref:Uncharacterized protein n=1 Tax=Jannaschia faecimaris TaxID=1244108 RepID=A0A1H3NXN3_9RHOB|nr:hypothetical protein SAMN05444004_104156 [Jannaschia faecimaris]